MTSEVVTSRTREAILVRVRACARVRTVWMEQLWSEGASSPDQGLAIPPGEVHRILNDPEVERQRYAELLGDPSRSILSLAAFNSGKALEGDPFWARMGKLFSLTPMEQDLLALCAAVEMEPRLGRVLAYLADDVRATRPTTAIAAALFRWSDELPIAMHGLLRWRLAHPLNGEAPWRATTAWQIDSAVIFSVLEGRWVDRALDRVARLIAPQQAAERPCLYPQLLERMIAELTPEGLARSDDSVVATLTGAEGSGRQTLSAQYAAAMGMPLISIAVSQLPATTEARADLLVQSVRLARAEGAILHWRNAELLGAQEWQGPSALGGSGLRSAQTPLPAATHRYALPLLKTAERIKAWEYFSSDPMPAIVRTQRLTPAEIGLVAKASPDATVHVALKRAVEAHGELMQPLACPYTWDDLVVLPSLGRLLKDFEAQILLRWQVYEEWGFSRLTHLGQGISALFGGPSGTGKTMAAQVIARSLGLELYRVDLAGVVNKYIGETEKRLRDVFDACERSGGLLFFDEADALFGKRTEVKDAHDRFANIEINYLLQRIEQFDGVAILATNRKNDLDTAFVRRLRFVMDFFSPDRPERLILWHKALHDRSPSGELIRGEIDFEMLARDLELNGAQIKSIALGAAFLARAAGKKIAMEHIELAAQREYAKQGQMMRATLVGSEAHTTGNGTGSRRAFHG
jgi:hypothetical protein